MRKKKNVVAFWSITHVVTATLPSLNEKGSLEYLRLITNNNFNILGVSYSMVCII